jgi:hypothetical protein
MLNRHLKVRNIANFEFMLLTFVLVIARQALAQEEAGDFNSDFPEAITIRPESPDGPCSC